MGRFASHRFIRGNRGRISRFFANTALLLVASVAIAVPLMPGVAHAAEQWKWVNEARIEVTGLSSPFTKNGEPFVDPNGKVLTFAFVDSNPYDTTRTFVDYSSGTQCKNNVKYSLTMNTPTGGTLTYITTLGGLDKVECKTATRGVSIGSTENASIESRPCTFTGSRAEELCAEQRQNGNAEWVRLCGFLGVPGAPSAPAGSICTTGGTSSTPGTSETGNTDDEDKDKNDPCDSLGDNSLSWIACPILTTTTFFIEKVDAVIEDQLHYDTNLFNRKTPNGQSFYVAWSSFRNIALGLVLLAGLVMVVSQGTGIQIFDAYTVRKVMPRLLIAVVGITLSWPILQFVVTFFNDTGHWLQDAMLLPFHSAAKSPDNNAIASAAGIGTLIGGAFLGGKAVLRRFGMGGIMSMVGTIALAILVGWLVITIRTVIITAAILFAPVAIACYILPNTKKVWDFWQNAMVTALIIFPIIMLLLGAGKAMALVSQDGFMKILFLVAPYFFLPFAFKLAGGLMSTIFSLTNDRGKGAFNRLSNMRQNIAKQRMGMYYDGRLNKDGTLGQKIALARGAFMRSEQKGKLNPLTKSGRATLSSAISTQRRIAAMRQANTDEHKVTQFDDPQLRAQMVGATEAEAVAGLRKYYPTMSEADITNAIGAARANGGFSKAIQIRAFEAAAASGTAIVDWRDGLAIGEHIAGDDTALRGQMAAMLKQRSVAAGRVEFGTGISDVYKAMTDIHDKGEASSYLNGRELTVQAALSQDLATILRGKPAAIKNIFEAASAELRDQNIAALNGDAAAQEKVAELSVLVEGLVQNTPYASVGNTISLRNNLEVPTREIRENVRRAAQATVEERTPMLDAQGNHMTDTAGNRLYETVYKEVRDNKGNVLLDNRGNPIQAPSMVQSTPNRKLGEYGYRNNPQDPNNISNTYVDLKLMRQPYGDPQDRRNANNERLQQ